MTPPDRHDAGAGGPSVCVAGAGLGGLCLAQGLRGAGIETQVNERDPAIAARFQGYRLVLNDAGLGALRGCLPPRLHPLLEAVLGDARGESLVLDSQLNQIGVLGVARSGIVADRQVLRHLLLTGLDVRTGAALRGYDVLDDGRVLPRFTGATPAAVDLLVGADGVGSAVRAQLMPDLVPTDTGVRFVIGRTPIGADDDALAAAYGSKITADGVTLLLGAMRFRMPPREAAERLAPDVALPDVADYVRWAMILPPDHPVDSSTAQAAALSLMDGWHPALRGVIERSDPQNSTLLSIRVVRPRGRWARGPVTLLGDAAHATSPTGGNGANTALRDADLLRRNLIGATAGTVGLRAAVGDYEDRMLEYGAEAVARSLAALPTFLPGGTGSA